MDERLPSLWELTPQEQATLRSLEARFTTSPKQGLWSGLKVLGVFAIVFSLFQLPWWANLPRELQTAYLFPLLSGAFLLLIMLMNYKVFRLYQIVRKYQQRIAELESEQSPKRP